MTPCGLPSRLSCTDVDVVTDGEQRRDNYASFVGGLLENCQLIPLTDLLPLVDDPEKFEKELQSLDVPASEVRHPAVFGKLRRGRPIATHELEFVRTLTDRPVKIALPGPYLLTRIMWMEYISDEVFADREELAGDIVRILREELHELLSAGAALVQFDEPVLTEVVFTGAKNSRSFMCGALSEKGSAEHELAFARELINRVVDDAPFEGRAIHVCRGNWTRDETAALTGDYRPLMPTLKALKVGNYLLELCTPRAGEIEALKELPPDRHIRIGQSIPKPRLSSLRRKSSQRRRGPRTFSVPIVFSSIPTAALQPLRTIRFAFSSRRGQTQRASARS